MSVQNVYCATCHVPLGVSRRDTRFFCGERCELSWPGLHADRNMLIRALYYAAEMTMQQIAERFGLSLRRVKSIVHGK